jgi:hypothetical protein
MGGLVESECVVCGKKITRSPSEMSKSSRSGPFCSKKCKAAYYSSKVQAVLNATCKFCGKEFHRPVSRNRNSNNVYCCREHWKLGIQSERRVYYTKFKKEVCEKCGFVPVHRCQLDIHHINGVRSDNSPDNLLTVCANCHRLISREENLRWNKSNHEKETP